VTLTLMTGVAYPALVYFVGRAAFPGQAGGSLVSRNHQVVGSSLVGQAFSRPEYFHPRPSAAGTGYDASQSGGTNLAPGNPKLIAAVTAAARAYRTENGLAADGPIPIDAVTSSGSGLDPDISPENARLQAPRVARARRLDPARVLALITHETRGATFDVLGQPRVPVLTLNLALDDLARGLARDRNAPEGQP
jgi:K+-transporting ATPase ATPase C chain